VHPIKQNLPPEFEKSVFNLDDYTNEMKVLIGEVMYQYGAMDGINYHRIIRKIRREGCNIDPPAL
jgi:hypothetical protein